MTPEYQPSNEAKAEKQQIVRWQSSSFSKLQRIVVASVLGCLGCAANDAPARSSDTYSATSSLDLPIADPALVTFEEIATISSDRFSPSRLQQLSDYLEIAEGSIRFHRIQISRQARGSQPSPSIASLMEEKESLEEQAQEVMDTFCAEAQFRIPFSRLQIPDFFQIQSLLDAQEEFHDDHGRLNTYLLHQMKAEEMKLRHLRLLIWICRQEREFSSEERSLHIQQLKAMKTKVESDIQLLQNAFHRSFQ